MKLLKDLFCAVDNWLDSGFCCINEVHPRVQLVGGVTLWFVVILKSFQCPGQQDPAPADFFLFYSSSIKIKRAPPLHSSLQYGLLQLLNDIYPQTN